jgi:hypothetical protein
VYYSQNLPDDWKHIGEIIGMEQSPFFHGLFSFEPFLNQNRWAGATSRRGFMSYPTLFRAVPGRSHPAAIRLRSAVRSVRPRM